MASFSENLDAAAGATVCQMLQQAGSALVGYGAISLAAGGTGFVPLSIGSVALLASNYGCTWDPDKDPSIGGAVYTGCQEFSGGSGVMLAYRVDLQQTQQQFSYTKIKSAEVGDFGAGLVTKFVYDDGPSLDQEWTGLVSTFKDFRGVPTGDATCAVPAPPEPDPIRDLPPVDYVDPDTNCVYNVAIDGISLDPSGTAAPVFKIQPGATTRSGGGIITGCNFEPVIYYGGPPTVPPRYGPWDPTWPDWDGSGTPPWFDLLNDILGGVVANIISSEIAKLWETNYPAGSRTIRAACEYKEDGTPETFTVNYPEEPYQSRVLTALDAITDFQQQILLWKTPTCSGGGSSVTGDPVSINWVSDEYSAAGGNRIRKLFTYFDQVGSTLEQTVAHWKDFTWNAGPVIVSCVGTPLGKPQVWADSVDEAKRVIQHAATIAGVDLTKAEWMVGSPRSTRYGETGLMRVHRSGNGTLGITKRDGPSGLPPALT